MQLGANYFSRFCKNKGVDLTFFCFAVEGQFEAILKQGLKHFPMLITADLAVRFGTNLVSLRAERFRNVCPRIVLLSAAKWIATVLVPAAIH